MLVVSIVLEAAALVIVVLAVKDSLGAAGLPDRQFHSARSAAGKR